VAEDVVDYLVLAQEDAASVGVHLPEQIALAHQAEERRVERRVAIHPGADDVGMLLLARHAALAAGRRCRMAVEYAADGGGDIIPLFEDRPLRDTVEAQVRDVGAAPAAPDEADAVLLVHTPIGQQRDVMETYSEAHGPQLGDQGAEMAERVRTAAGSGRWVGLADAAYCNGADPELVSALRETGAMPRLAAYAGWNTAANTVGTVVSHLSLAALSDPRAGPEARRTSARFVANRLIDDYAYQSCVRQRAVERSKSSGANPHALGNAAPELQRYVGDSLQPYAREIWARVEAERTCGSLVEARASLPWDRLFEVELELLTSPSSAEENGGMRGRRKERTD
jgi:hypothetical protein